MGWGQQNLLNLHNFYNLKLTCSFKYMRHHYFQIWGYEYGSRTWYQEMKMKTKEISSAHQGRIQHFHLGGGGAWKIMCAHAHHGHKARRPLWPGSRVRLRDLEALGVFFYALSCYLSLIFKHSDTKWEKKNHSQSNLGGGGAPVAPPLNLPWHILFIKHSIVPDFPHGGNWNEVSGITWLQKSLRETECQTSE